MPPHVPIRAFSTLPPRLPKHTPRRRRVRATLQSGQPLHETRPHLVQPGQLTPGISAAEYFSRRLRIANALRSRSTSGSTSNSRPSSSSSSSSCPSILAILAGNKVHYASGPVFYPFQQNTDLFYLTGWNEPDSIAVLELAPHEDEPILHMVVPRKDPYMELWQGARTGVQGAMDIFNADSALANDDPGLLQHIQSLVKRSDIIYYDGQWNNQYASTIQKAIDSVSFAYRNKTIYKDLSRLVAAQRVIKSSAELAVMARASYASALSFNEALSQSAFLSEKQLQSFLEYRFIQNGADKSAYVPVVASGSNALCVHYTINDDLIYNDELVLVDAAGSYGGYCSDISRTWPANATGFTPAQKELYQAVLNVQKQCILQSTQASGHSLNDIHQLSVDLMVQELKNCGLASIDRSKINTLYPHYIGHNLGLDVHDAPEYSRLKPLQENQVITIEPGVYVPDDPAYPEHFRNIGIRIEDDIRVGIDDSQILTIDAVKEISDIESRLA
ncbi:hypothetical protein TBLA_0F01960 [Henningerozyma blattae CBS 6284]|uniref:Aminopeptidase P N-terminal domain-containing protein n=1 Tax=Henningerozyma blattae (strain ATCC 34711 / CBS 6284 / DSM 70876 / NBRC 10599 / NRRL Y-10934 / UCD 77-7) TaxID=1071380 RepID=I2H5T6_HENB6|nr:hypothetical protein TBLA_0F01960 [Tetrapisispora blattae CBS 6284]CCH61738.1 hypothetical protein TBLA_0F01960 [Tetrapisispora blattae CBS 6284]